MEEGGGVRLAGLELPSNDLCRTKKEEEEGVQGGEEGVQGGGEGYKEGKGGRRGEGYKEMSSLTTTLPSINTREGHKQNSRDHLSNL